LMSDTELCFTGARKLARMIRTRKVSASEVMRAFLARIERVNPKVNAIVTLVPERALAQAAELDRRLAARSAEPGPLAGLPDEVFDKIFANNVKSVLWLANLTLPGMAERGGGSFITVGSIGGMKANTVIGAYGISKAADHHLVRNLAAEWGPKNVRVNAIAPGPFRTHIGGPGPLPPAAQERWSSMVPLGRMGDPAEIRGLALLLASGAGSFITGGVYPVDGGQLLQGPGLPPA